MFPCLRLQLMHILLGAKVWLVPGFNFNQKVFFHVLILEEGKHTSVTDEVRLENYPPITGIMQPWSCEAPVA